MSCRLIKLSLNHNVVLYRNFPFVIMNFGFRF